MMLSSTATYFNFNQQFRFMGKDVDAMLFISVMLLLTIGIVMVASASVDYAAYRFNDPLLFIKKHMVFVMLGFLVFALALSVPIRTWQANGVVLLLLALALLLLVLVPGIGKKVNGSQRWLSLAGFTLQVSELAKVFVVIYLSGFVLRREKEFLGSFWGFIKPMLVIFFVVFLLLLEPDFGAAVVVLLSSLGVVFVAGVPLFRFLLMMVACVAAASMIAVLEPYRLKRLATFMNPWAEDVKFDGGYQLTQSLIAFGRGEWFGVGLGNSVQKLFYLPEAHTDFVFSIWAEELGLVGVLIVLGLFLMLAYRMVCVGVKALKHNEKFMAYITAGFVLIITGQVFINVGVASGLLPTKGLTLPFISYGGSSLLVCCLMVGIVLRIQWELTALYGSEEDSAEKAKGKTKTKPSKPTRRSTAKGLEE